jgi:hypothetical protein
MQNLILAVLEHLALTRTPPTLWPADWHNGDKYCKMVQVGYGCSVDDASMTR